MRAIIRGDFQAIKRSPDAPKGFRFQDGIAAVDPPGAVKDELPQIAARFGATMRRGRL